MSYLFDDISVEFGFEKFSRLSEILFSFFFHLCLFDNDLNNLLYFQTLAREVYGLFFIVGLGY